jgi:enoyl-[acyl-carrier protein] reductase I
MADEMQFPKGKLMRGKKGLIMGVANKNSIAWGIARQLHAQGAELGFTYLGDALEKRVRPLAESVDASIFTPCDVADDASLEAAFAEVQEKWGELDFLVHSIGFAGREGLKGSFIENTSRENFKMTMDISAFSFVAAAKLAAPLMKPGSSMITLTYLGSERVIPNYNVMGVAKAALEACTRYMARDLGPKGIRVNAISAGPMRTLAMAGISGGRGMLSTGKDWSLLKEDTSMEGVAGSALWLLSDLGRSVAGEVVHVDAGFHVVGMPESAE